MAVEIENAPACCRRSLERIHDVYDSAGCLSEFLAAAPSIAKPGMTRLSWIGVLWRLASGVWSWKKFRKPTSKLLQPIVKNRVDQIIDFELFNHNNEPELSKQWTHLKDELAR